MTKQKVEELDRTIQSLKDERQQIIKDMQETCDHPIEFVIEGEYKEGFDIGYADPPFRVCRLCGLAEEGWGCG